MLYCVFCKWLYNHFTHVYIYIYIYIYIERERESERERLLYQYWENPSCNQANLKYTAGLRWAFGIFCKADNFRIVCGMLSSTFVWYDGKVILFNSTMPILFISSNPCSANPEYWQMCFNYILAHGASTLDSYEPAMVPMLNNMKKGIFLWPVIWFFWMRLPYVDLNSFKRYL